MGTIKLDTITPLSTTTDITIASNKFVGNSSGNMTVVGEGGSTQTNLQQGLVKAWCKFDGEASTIANADSFNVSGLTDNGTGDYTVVINNDMANGDYATTCNGTEQVFSVLNNANTLAGSVRVYSKNLSDSNIDSQYTAVQITGDLA